MNEGGLWEGFSLLVPGSARGSFSSFPMTFWFALPLSFLCPPLRTHKFITCVSAYVFCIRHTKSLFVVFRSVRMSCGVCRKSILRKGEYGTVPLLRASQSRRMRVRYSIGTESAGDTASKMMRFVFCRIKKNRQKNTCGRLRGPFLLGSLSLA